MNSNDNKKPPIPWLIFIFLEIIAFSTITPAGILLLLFQLGIIGGKKTVSRSSDTAASRDARRQKYRSMAAGRTYESIDNLAAAAGVSFSDCLQDLQLMVAEGQFGPDAYINYIDKTLVLNKPNRSAGHASTSSSTRSSFNPVEHVYTSSRVGNSSSSGASVSETNSKPVEEKRARDKKLYGILPVVMIIIASLMLLVGLIEFSDALDMLTGWNIGVQAARGMLSGALWLSGGAVSLAASGLLRKRANRAKILKAALTGQDNASLDALSQTTGIKMKTLERDLEIMIEKNMLGQDAYIDHGRGYIVLKPGSLSQDKEEKEDVPDDDESRYRDILRQIRQVNDDIPDPVLSARIDEMEDLTAKIFSAVQENPEKLPQIKSFMSYYLPTALKLLRSYADFDSSGADGQNIRTAKADIERILDTLVDGFRKQLDKLYEADAIDVSSDINVLETMLRRDGLSGDGSGFGVTGGH